MSRQFMVLSIILLISVTINVGFIFDKLSGDREQITVFNADKADLLQEMVVELGNLKNIAETEGAPRTGEAIDRLIREKNSQIQSKVTQFPAGRK